MEASSISKVLSGAFLGVIAGVITLFIFLILPKVRCQNCGKKVLKFQKKCRHCGSIIDLQKITALEKKEDQKNYSLEIEQLIKVYSGQSSDELIENLSGKSQATWTPAANEAMKKVLFDRGVSIPVVVPMIVPPVVPQLQNQAMYSIDHKTTGGGITLIIFGSLIGFVFLFLGVFTLIKAFQYPEIINFLGSFMILIGGFIGIMMIIRGSLAWKWFGVPNPVIQQTNLKRKKGATRIILVLLSVAILLLILMLVSQAFS